MKKLSYKIVKEIIEKEGYVLISKEYINANSKLHVKCDKGHEYIVNYSHFNRGQRCPVCHNKIRSKNQKLSYEFIKKQIEKEEYKLLSRRYINSNSKLKIECPMGHVYYTTYGNFYRKQRCSVCFHITNGEEQKLKYEFIKEQIEKKGYELLSKKYINNIQKLLIKCPEGHIYKTTYSNFQQDRRCPHCNPMYSKAEKEIVKYLKTLNIDIIENDRKQIINPLTGRNLELDIFIPDHYKAIEFNGKYWHSFEDAKERDIIKKQQCKEKGIDLLVIKERDWINNRDECLNEIRNFL